MNYLLWMWLTIAELVVVELPLAIVAWGATTNTFYISSAASLVWRIIAFLINAIAWAIIVYIADPLVGGERSARTRGAALSRAQNLYFAVPALVHLFIITLWIAFRVQFAGLSPLSFFVNIDAFAVLRSIELISLLMFTVILGFWFFESRHSRLHVRITQITEQKKPKAPGET